MFAEKPERKAKFGGSDLKHSFLFFLKFCLPCISVYLSHYLTNHHTHRCNDTRGCVMQFWPDDEHMCSKHVEAWNKTYCKTKFCASSWLNTEINILSSVRSCWDRYFPLLHAIQPPHLISPRDPYVSQHFPLPPHSLLEAGNFSGCRNIRMNPACVASETL